MNFAKSSQTSWQGKALFNMSLIGTGVMFHNTIVSLFESLVKLITTDMSAAASLAIIIAIVVIATWYVAMKKFERNSSTPKKPEAHPHNHNKNNFNQNNNRRQ